MVGLVGGVASGKSTVAGMLRELGAEVIDADRLAHEALDDPSVRRRVVEAFGEGVLGRGARKAGRRVDRRCLGGFAFRSRREIARLESIVHPWVLGRIERRLGRLARRHDPPSLVLLDVVLLLESGADRLCDRIVFVKAPRRAREARAVRERAWGEGEVARRERFQRSLAAKLRRADEVIDNDGPLDATRSRVREVFQRLARASRRGVPRRPALRAPRPVRDGRTRT